MTLQEAIEIQSRAPDKKIIREPNHRGWTDVYFKYHPDIKKLVVYSYEGTKFRCRVASFQKSPHTDWIVI